MVQPQTLIRWHRAGWKLLWLMKSRPGRPPIPQPLQALIRRMASENPSWGEERIANELLAEAGNSGRYDYLLHDRDSSFAQHLDESVKKLGINVLKSPPRSPMANAICERVIGTIRRECLDWLIPLSGSHLRSILKSGIPRYNAGHPHMALGPGVPDPPPAWCDYQKASSRHRRGESYAVHANPILGGLHHEYSLAPALEPSTPAL